MHSRLKREIAAPEFTTELVRDLAMWKLHGALSTVTPPIELSAEQQLTAASIVAGAWGRMAETALPPCTAAILSSNTEGQSEAAGVCPVYTNITCTHALEQCFTRAMYADTTLARRDVILHSPEIKAPPGTTRDVAASSSGPAASGHAALPGSKTVRLPAPTSAGVGVPTFPVGSHARTRAGKQKALYDDQRGEVVALLSKKARVKMLSGNAAGHADALYTHIIKHKPYKE